jgi:hypothetical protein
MPPLAERIDFVLGVDTHKRTHTAAVVTPTGGVLAHLTVPADAGGYGRLLAFARAQAPGRRLWPVEGTGSFGAGLTAALHADREEFETLVGARAGWRRESRVGGGRRAWAQPEPRPRGRGWPGQSTGRAALVRRAPSALTVCATARTRWCTVACAASYPGTSGFRCSGVGP